MRKILDLRTTDISLYYFLANNLSNDNYTILSGHSYPMVASGLYLIDGYPEDPEIIKLPTVSIEHYFTDEVPFQLGPGRTDERAFGISVFARSDGERDDLSELIRNYFSSQHINIYDYNIIYSGGNSEILARARADYITLTAQRFDQPIKALKHVMKINFTLTVDICTGYSLIT